MHTYSYTVSIVSICNYDTYYLNKIYDKPIKMSITFLAWLPKRDRLSDKAAIKNPSIINVCVILRY